MPNKSVSCIATSREQADLITHQIRAVNFSGNNISLRFPNRELFDNNADQNRTWCRKGAVSGAVLGGVIGGWLGWFGELAATGSATFLAAESVSAVLIGSVLGATIVGAFGGLIGMGIPESDAGQNKSRVAPVKILISVHTQNPEEITRATVAFTTAGAQDICTIDDEKEL